MGISIILNNLQPFKKRLDQKTTFWEKVGPKNNLLKKGWTKKQPFKKGLDQKYRSDGIINIYIKLHIIYI